MSHFTLNSTLLYTFYSSWTFYILILKHTNLFLNIKNYTHSKLKLIYQQNSNDRCFVNLSEDYIKKYIKLKRIDSKIKNIKLKNLNFLKKKIRNKYFLNLSNLKNLQFAINICKFLKIKQNKVLNIANKFKSLNYRQQILFNKKNITCINDSKSTSFASSIDILKSYDRGSTLLIYPERE